MSAAEVNKQWCADVVLPPAGVSLVLHPVQQRLVLAQQRAGQLLRVHYELGGEQLGPLRVRYMAEHTATEVQPSEEWPRMS